MKIKFLALAFVVASLAACSNAGAEKKDECCAKGEEKECCDKAEAAEEVAVDTAVVVADTVAAEEVEAVEVEETEEVEEEAAE